MSSSIDEKNIKMKENIPTQRKFLKSDEKIINKRIKKFKKVVIFKKNETDIHYEKNVYDNNKKDVELKKFQMDKCIKDVEITVFDKEKRRNVLIQNEFEKERNYLIDQQKIVKSQIEEVSKNNMNEKFIKMLKDEVNLYLICR